DGRSPPGSRLGIRAISPEDFGMERERRARGTTRTSPVGRLGEHHGYRKGEV
ncbi:MAG: hypothetical protein AVDCRST_MAG28-1851, partial [uncultured Rubrobacteraceae bacterium]